MANPLRYPLPPAELSSHREEEVEEGDEEVGIVQTFKWRSFSIKRKNIYVSVAALIFNMIGFRGRGGGGPSFDMKGGDWPCPNRFV